jgi:hypothetical protein
MQQPDLLNVFLVPLEAGKIEYMVIGDSLHSWGLGNRCRVEMRPGMAIG